MSAPSPSVSRGHRDPGAGQVERRHQRGQAARLEADVGVEHEHRRRVRRGGDGGVDPGRVAGVASRLHDRGLGAQAPRHRDRVVGRVVVHHDEVPGDVTGAVGQRRHQAGQHVGAVPGHHRDGHRARRGVAGGVAGRVHVGGHASTSAERGRRRISGRRARAAAGAPAARRRGRRRSSQNTRTAVSAMPGQAGGRERAGPAARHGVDDRVLRRRYGEGAEVGGHAQLVLPLLEQTVAMRVEVSPASACTSAGVRPPPARRGSWRRRAGATACRGWARGPGPRRGHPCRPWWRPRRPSAGAGGRRSCRWR